MSMLRREFRRKPFPTFSLPLSTTWKSFPSSTNAGDILSAMPEEVEDEIVELLGCTLDLGVFHRNAHVVSFREAMGWSLVWITIGLSFTVFIYLSAYELKWRIWVVVWYFIWIIWTIRT